MRPKRPFPKNHGSLGEEPYLAGFIRQFPRHPPNRCSQMGGPG
jgi:hypothetical protein